MGATTEFIRSDDRVCLASSGTIGNRPGCSCRPRMVCGWLLVVLPLKETFCSASLFSVFTAFSPYKKYKKDKSHKKRSVQESPRHRKKISWSDSWMGYQISLIQSKMLKICSFVLIFWLILGRILDVYGLFWWNRRSSIFGCLFWGVT